VSLQRRQFIVGVAAGVLAVASGIWWQQRSTLNYLDGDTAAFVASFDPPPRPGSPDTRRELDRLLEMQRIRSDAEVAAARADRKTEVSRFYPAMGLDADAQLSLPRVSRLAQRVEDDVRPYVRAAKKHFRRLRPAEIESRLTPCIGNVKEDLSYPSGHATYGYVMAYMLADLVPEWRTPLESRADEFATQRMVCGVHFRSDIEAGQRGARWLIERLHASARYRADAQAAAAELRAALQSAQGAGHSSASRAPPSDALDPADARPR
jgi:acid phosphatase (class A)